MFFDAESKNDVHFIPSEQLLAAGGAENWPKMPIFEISMHLAAKNWSNQPKWIWFLDSAPQKYSENDIGVN